VEVAGKLSEATFKQVTSTRQARQFAELALEVERQRAAAGQSTYFVVLELQRDLTAARSAEIRALTEYQKSLVQLAFSEGSTLERTGLEVLAK